MEALRLVLIACTLTTHYGSNGWQMIIFPPLAEFNSCITSPSLVRTRTAKCTQFVTTLADFEALLLQLTMGFMPKLAFVLPIDGGGHGERAERACPVWRSIVRVLGDHNCHWTTGAGADDAASQIEMSAAG